MKKASGSAGAGKAPKQARAPKAGAAHKLAAPMPAGTVLTDLRKGQWKLGKPIGSGGFGLIYLAQNSERGNEEYVMKLEPHDNGPLFCELHFYQRAAQQEAIKEWMTARRLKTLGVPKFVAAGNHDRDGKKYRFMVMQRFGTDLQKLFESNGRAFPQHTVYLLGLKLMDVLEYLHEKDYVHADIKAANIMTGHSDPHQIYLIDYGLAFRYVVDGKHKEYKEDPRKAHDGTVEFTSRDAHKGVCPSRRGDLEILGYCMLQWLCGTLPWEDRLDNKDYVRNKKIGFMKDIPKSVPGRTGHTTEVLSYLQYVASLGYEQKPDYDRCRQLFSAALKKLGHKDTEPLQLELDSAVVADKSPAAKKAAAKKRPLASRSRSPSASPGNGVSPTKARRVNGKQTDATISLSSDEEEDEQANGDRQRTMSRSPAQPKKRVWPKAKVGPSAAANKNPITIAQAKLAAAEGGSENGRVSVAAARAKKIGAAAIARTESLSPVAIIKAKTSGIPAAAASPARAGQTPKGSAKRAVVVKRKRKVEASTIATQTSPGLGGLPRSQLSRPKKT